MEIVIVSQTMGALRSSCRAVVIEEAILCKLDQLRLLGNFED
jgi:hypothetical protein